MPGPGSDKEGEAGARFACKSGKTAAKCLFSRRREVAEKVADALDRFGDCLEAVGIGKPNVVLAEGAEAGAGDRRHPGLVEQLGLEAAGVVAGAGDALEGVESAARRDAANARQAVQRRDD